MTDIYQLELFDDLPPLSANQVNADDDHSTIAGALFDFIGFLSTREEVVQAGAATQFDLVNYLCEFADRRALRLTPAAVQSSGSRYGRVIC